jgi:quinoprotein glucose dehydrogenase
MYVLARNTALVALDATTGKEIWVHEKLNGISQRGVAFWESKDRKDRRLIFAMNNYLEEIDALTGKSILTFGQDGVVSLKENLGRDPRTVFRIQSGTPGKIFENLIILGSATGEGFISPPGDIRAYDVLSGKMVWTFHTVPHPGEFGYDTWPKDAWKYAGGTNNWGEMSIDEKRGIIYVPLGSSTYDFYGADRKGMDLFANCLVALDARTGRRLWHFQEVHHDLWDWDSVSAPQLITVRHNGKQVDAVAHAGKTGFLYVLDRVTGQPLWPIDEKSVPKSDVPGEEAWPTQPFPTKPPAFARQTFTTDDINPYILTPEERANIKDRVASAVNKGMFTPPSFRDTISMPGNQGGSNWGTTAANPATGVVYVLNVDEPAILRLDKDQPGSGRAGAAASPGQAVYQQNCAACHGADRAGSGAAPSLVDITIRVDLDVIRATITNGKGQMPSFNLGEEQMNGVLGYLINPNGPGGRVIPPAVTLNLGGPVVGSGGAPAGQAAAVPGGGRAMNPYGSMGGPPYPAGTNTPTVRYYTGYGVMGNIIKPPYSTLTAYDLNQGTIKWQIPVGDDPRAMLEGAHNTGAIGLRTGVIPTSTGLIFEAGGDGKIRAYDEDDGKVLWTADLPGGSRGIPSMYEINGREYLVVNATSPMGNAAGRAGAPDPDTAQRANRGYVAFALPAKVGK